jgi:uncharacterized membrane protein YbhN (UPF0104 family)
MASAPPRGWSLRHGALTLTTVALLVWTLLSLGDVAEALRATLAIWTQPLLLAIFVTSYTAAFALRALAWSVLLGVGSKPRVVRLFGFLQMALLANHVFPTKVGEVVRVALLVRAGIALPRAASSTVVARLVDLGSLCALAALGLALVGEHASLPAAWLVLPTLVVLAASVVLIAVTRAKRVPPVVDRFRQGLRTITLRQALLALACTLPSWALEALALWTVAQAAGTQLSPGLAVAATAFTIAFQGFQVTPGGIGLYEASLTTALTLYGVDPATAFALALATHALKFAYSFAAGLPAALAEVGHAARLARRLRPVDLVFAAAPVVALLSGRSVLDCALGVVVLLPLCVAFRCHHLPRRLRPLVLVPIAAYAVVFGPTSPVAAGADRPQDMLAFGMLSLLGLVLTRQWWLAHRPLPAPASLTAGCVAVVIPVHDEALSIANVVAGIPRDYLAKRGFSTIVIVVDDGSTDASGALARRAGADHVISHPSRRGLGAALRSGLVAARTLEVTAVVYLDGDGEYDSRDLPTVVEPVLSGQADYVLGVRFPGASRSMRLPRRLGNGLLTLLQSLLTGQALHDGQTGFRAFGPRALAAAEIIHDYNYAQVLTLDLLRKRLRLAEVPIRYRVRRGGRSFIRYHEYAFRVLPAIAREVLLP